MAYKIFTIPFDKSKKAFDTQKLNQFCKENLILDHIIELVNDDVNPYWTVLLEYKEKADQDLKESYNNKLFSNLSTLISEYNITEREVEIIHCVVKGYSNKNAAENLGITESTIKAHLTSIYHKVGAANRIQMLNKLMIPELFNQIGKQH